MTEDDLNVMMQIPKGHLILILLVGFLIAGSIIGYLVGGYVSQQRWEKYDVLREEKYERECTCLNTSVEIDLKSIFGGIQ